MATMTTDPVEQVLLAELETAQAELEHARRQIEPLKDAHARAVVAEGEASDAATAHRLVAHQARLATKQPGEPLPSEQDQLWRTTHPSVVKLLGVQSGLDAAVQAATVRTHQLRQQRTYIEWHLIKRLAGEVSKAEDRLAAHRASQEQTREKVRTWSDHVDGFRRKLRGETS
jgi:hypothetical protein